MSYPTHQTAVTKYINAKGTKLAYRDVGKAEGVPLVMMGHFRSNMDWWDPALIDRLAAQRHVILLDNAGVGKSEGKIPATYAGWADHVINLIQALGHQQADVFGFSMGGAAVQMVALNAPKGLVRRVIIAGTVPSAGPDATKVTDWHPFEVLKAGDSPEAIFRGWAYSFFPNTNKGRFDARASWDRINLRQQDRAPYMSAADADAQTATFMEDWAVDKKENSYHRFHELRMPVLIANGDEDRLCPTPNSWFMFERIRQGGGNVHLRLYPRAGHGFLYQHAGLFAAHIGEFLDAPDEREEYPVTAPLDEAFVDGKWTV